jgi:hypothetical protein
MMKLESLRREKQSSTTKFHRSKQAGVQKDDDTLITNGDNDNLTEELVSIEQFMQQNSTEFPKTQREKDQVTAERVILRRILATVASTLTRL